MVGESRRELFAFSNSAFQIFKATVSEFKSERYMRIPLIIQFIVELAVDTKQSDATLRRIFSERGSTKESAKFSSCKLDML